MVVLINEAIMSQICDELSKSKESIMIVSAYCKLSMIRQFDMYIDSTGIEKVLLVRFRPEDIISKASDLELYQYCKLHGWKLYFRLDLHAKTYVFDKVRCIIGSANATKSGMGLSNDGNFEMATTCLLAEKDVRDLKLLLKGSIEITDDIYHRMKAIIDAYSGDKSVAVRWPEEIIAKGKPDYSLLLSEDFPGCFSPVHSSDDDLLFLNLTKEADLGKIRERMEKAKCYIWLKNLLKDTTEHEMYFGAITVQLHNQLLDEPKPFRKDVKALLANLINWILILECTDFIVDRPNHSQRIRLME